MFFLMEAPLISFTLGTSPPLISAHDGACYACHANMEMGQATERFTRGLGVGRRLHRIQGMSKFRTKI